MREAAGRERAEKWGQAMQARRDAEAARSTQREARLKANYQKAKVLCVQAARVSGQTTNTHFIVKRQTMLTPLSNYGNLGSASPSFRLSVCVHTLEFSCYAHKEFKKLDNMVIYTQNTRKHTILHRNSTQGEESNLQQSSSTHKQSIQKHTTVSPQV